MHDTAMSAEQREIIEQFGLLHEEMGGTRMTGRVTAWLLLCSPPEQSLTTIAEGLGVSKAAVSVAARMVLQARLIERVAVPGKRGDYYRATSADVASMLPLEQVRTFRRLFALGLTTIRDRDQTQTNYAIMRERLDFLTFIEEELDGLLARWEQRRAGAATPGAFAPDDDATLPSGGTT